MEHRRPKAGDAPHEGLLKVERREFRCSGGVQGVFRGSSGGVQGVFRGCSGGVQGVFRGCSGGVQGGCSGGCSGGVQDLSV